jgi:hypothetical protein
MNSDNNANIMASMQNTLFGFAHRPEGKIQLMLMFEA